MKRKAHTAIIEGQGQFPMDMLRYDRAFPASEKDSAAITRTFMFRSEAWKVSVTSEAMFTVERWASFGCKVSQ